MKHTLLVELLTEELPPKALGKLGEAFASAMFHGLSARAFVDDGATCTAYASPRRLAVQIDGVRASSPDKQIREKVLPVSVAIDKEGITIVADDDARDLLDELRDRDVDRHDAPEQIILPERHGIRDHQREIGRAHV